MATYKMYQGNPIKDKCHQEAVVYALGNVMGGGIEYLVTRTTRKLNRMNYANAFDLGNQE